MQRSAKRQNNRKTEFQYMEVSQRLNYHFNAKTAKRYLSLNQELHYIFFVTLNNLKFDYNKSENAINGSGIFVWADFTYRAFFFDISE